MGSGSVDHVFIQRFNMPSLIARLAKAKSRLFGTAPQNVAVPFDVPCDCGHRVTGIRRSSYQLAECSACQSSIYVLPVNVYPTNKRIRSEVVDGPVAQRVGTVVRDLVLGEQTSMERRNEDSRASVTAKGHPGSNDATSDEQEKSTKRRRRAATESNQKGGSTENEASPVTAESVIAVMQLPRVSLAVHMRRFFSPTRLLAIAGLGILAATGWWMVHQARINVARKVWRAELDRAETALEKRDLTTLGEALTLAVNAGRILGRDDAEFRLAHSQLRQTIAVQKLTSIDLIASMSGVLQQNGSINAEKAKLACDAIEGQQMAFEAVLNTSPEKNGHIRLDFPLIVDGCPVEISVNSAVLARLASEEGSYPALFAAKIMECTAPSNGQDSWRLLLQGDSCTLITTSFHAEQLGFDVKASAMVKQTVERQAELIRSIDPSLLAETDDASNKEQRP